MSPRSTRLVFATGLLLASLAASDPVSAADVAVPCERPTNMTIAFGDIVTCSIQMAGASDVYRFAGNAGDVVEITLAHTGSPFGPTVEATVFDPAQSEIAQLATAQASQGVTSRIVLATAGLYTVLVRGGGDVTATSYNLALQRLFPVSSDATDLCTSCVRSDAITPAADSDVARFDGNAGDVLEITLTQTGSPFGPRVTASVFDPLQNEIAQLATAQGAQGATQRVTLDATGSYAILVRGGGDITATSYNLALQRLFPSRADVSCLCVGCVLPSAIETAASSDLARFAGNTGDVVEITLAHTGSPFGPTVEATVFDPAQSEIAQLATAQASQGVTSRIVLATAGLYTVLVRGGGDVTATSYNLALQRLFPVPSDATGLCTSCVRSDAITPAADSDVARFDGNAGDVLEITLTQTGSPFGPRVTASVFDPLQNEVTQLATAQGAQGATQRVTLDATGSYAILVRGGGDITATSYNLGVQCLFGDCANPRLLLNKSGAGRGEITSAPGGVICGSDCSESYAGNPDVRLVPKPYPGSVFASFSGDADCTDGDLILDENRACLASFEDADPNTHVLGVRLAGIGTGTVLVGSEPECRSDCEVSRTTPETVALTAVPDPGSVFERFEGDPSCECGAVAIDADKLCVARFTTTVEHVAETLAPDGTLTTDREGPDGAPDGVSLDDPIETFVTTPSGGPTEIVERGISQESRGYAFFGQQVDITAPEESADDPLVLRFLVDPSRLPADSSALRTQMFRNGDRVPRCEATTVIPQPASPDPCVLKKDPLENGGLDFTILSSAASDWNLGTEVLGPRNLTTPRAAKEALTCRKGLAKAAGAFVAAKLASLETCSAGVTKCLQGQPAGDARARCLAKATCAKELAAIAKAEAKLRTSVVKRCANVPATDLVSSPGLGFRGLDCESEFGIDVSDHESLAECLRRHHGCRAERLFDVQSPRFVELATRVAGGDGVALPLNVGQCLVDHLGAGESLPNGAADGKALIKCAKAVTKAGLSFTQTKLAHTERCLAGIFACVQTKPDDAKCLTKAAAKCDTALDAELGRVAKAAGKLAATLAKACGTVDFSAVLASSAGLNLSALADECAGFGAGSGVASLAEYTTCVIRQHSCLADDLIRVQVPRLKELLTDVGREDEIPAAFCP